MERTRIYRAALALDNFTVGELAAHSGANPNTVRSLLTTRGRDLFEVIGHQTRVGRGRPAQRFRVSHREAVQEMLREEQRDLTDDQDLIERAADPLPLPTVDVPELDPVDDLLLTLAWAESQILRAHSCEPEEIHSLVDLADDAADDVLAASAGMLDGKALTRARLVKLHGDLLRSSTPLKSQQLPLSSSESAEVSIGSAHTKWQNTTRQVRSTEFDAPDPKRGRMAEATGAASDSGAAARDSGTRYGRQRLAEVANVLLLAAVRGEIGRTTVARLARDLRVSEKLIRTLLHQTDDVHALSFLSQAIVHVQARELAHALYADGGPGLGVWARSPATSPPSTGPRSLAAAVSRRYGTKGIHTSYGGKYAFGLQAGRETGTFDSLFATYMTARGEQSINFGGIVKALDKDREWLAQNPVERMHLSPLQKLSLDRPTAAMFAHAGSISFAALSVMPPEAASVPYVFLQGRYEGIEESIQLASPTQTVAIVSEPGYHLAARRAFGDKVDLAVDAEGSSPGDCGLCRRHVYVRPNGAAVSNAEVRAMIDCGEYHRLDDWIQAEDRGILLIMFPGELRASLPGSGHEGGQPLLLVTDDQSMRWFCLLNKSNGDPSWNGDAEETRERLQRLVEAFALLEAPDSTAGHTRRQQFESLELFDIPTSDPAARENVWRIAAAARQVQLRAIESTGARGSTFERP